MTGKLLTLDERAEADAARRCWRCSTCPSTTPRGRRSTRRSAASARWTRVKRLLLRESQVQPLLLVFEDLHWIDAETQALLDSLVESLPTARLLLLVNYRPEYQHGWGSKTYYTPAPARPAAARERRGAAGRAARATTRRSRPLKPLLIERTEGNPFFLEESVRTLVETRALVGRARAPIGWPSRSHGIQVPATVQAILAARIDRLAAGGQAAAPGRRGHRQGRAVRAAPGDRRAARGRTCARRSRSCRPPSSSTRRASSRTSSTRSSTR